MREERAALKGQLAECEEELQDLESRAENQVLILRVKASPTASLLELDTAKILTAAQELANLHLLAKQQAARIRKIKDALGEK